MITLFACTLGLSIIGVTVKSESVWRRAFTQDVLSGPVLTYEGKGKREEQKKVTSTAYMFLWISEYKLAVT